MSTKGIFFTVAIAFTFLNIKDRFYSERVRRTNIQHSNWLSSYNTVLSLVESFRVLKYFLPLKGPIIGALSVATPAVLCHKEPARRKNTPYQGYFLLLAGSLWHEDSWLSCTTRSYQGWLHARKGPIRGAPNRFFPCMEATYPYDIKNQRGARNTPQWGYFCDELVLYGIRLLAQHH